MFLLVNNRPIQSADSIGFWPIVSVSADSQNSTIGRPLQKVLPERSILIGKTFVENAIY